jgi:hypothetical protein
MVVTRRPARLAAFGLALLGLLSAVAGSHAVMVAHPRPVADLIRTAASQEAP